MQNAKDTFYEVLRDRVAAGNAARTVVVRGVVRPAVVVVENELANGFGAGTDWLDCFQMRWTGLAVDAASAAVMVAMECEVFYATAGVAGGGGMDRGRALAAMDGELRAAVDACPSTVKKNFAGLAGGGAAVAMGSRVWWGDLKFGAVKTVGDELQRTATVTVWSYQEAGEV